MSNVLIVSPVATHPKNRGNRQRISQIAENLVAAGHNVELAMGFDKPVNAEAKQFWPTIHSLQRSPDWRPTRRNVSFDSWYTPGLGEEISQLVRRQRIDVVILNYVFHSKLLDFLPRDVIRIIDTHDVFTDRNALYSQHRYSGGFFSCSVEDEARYLSRAEVILAITESDANHFRKIAPHVPTITLPYIPPRVENANISDPSGKRLPGRDSTSLVFGMVLSANDLNLASLYSFVRAVDREFGRKPPFTVRIAGEIKSLAITHLPYRRITFQRPWLQYDGHLDNLDLFYGSLDAALVPVIAGSGMAIKFFEAISRGVPVLSTERGSRGHKTSHPFHAFPTNEEVARSLHTLSPESLLNLRHAGDALVEISETQAIKGWNELTKYLNHCLNRSKSSDSVA